MANDALHAADRQLIADVWTSDEAWTHCEALVDRFPRRYAGHPDEAGARDYLLETLARYGVAAHSESFPCVHWTAGPAVPSWGRMLADGRDYLERGWWIATAPGIAIMLVVLAVNTTGDWLRDALDPRLRL